MLAYFGSLKKGLFGFLTELALIDGIGRVKVGEIVNFLDSISKPERHDV